MTASGFKLGQWLVVQRTRHKQGALSKERQNSLESAGIVWNPLEARWEDAFARFVALPPAEDGTRSTHQSYIDSDGFKLGQWQHTQRIGYRRGILSAERVARLGAAGFVWVSQRQFSTSAETSTSV